MLLAARVQGGPVHPLVSEAGLMSQIMPPLLRGSTFPQHKAKSG